MSWREYMLFFVALGLASYLPRWLPLAYLAHRKLPDWLVDWLGFIPVAIMASLLAPALFVDGGSLSLGKTELWAALPTLVFAWKTKSIGGTLLFGMMVFWLMGMARG